jgi:PAS domain S-box-containing protein
MQRRNIVILSISIVFFTIYLFIIYTNYTQNKNYLLEYTKNNQIKLVHAYKEKFDEKLLALKRIVESIGQNLIIKDREKEFWTIKESLTYAMRSGSGFTSVYIAYPDNFTISGRPDWFYTKDYIATERPWYIEAITKGKTTITQPYEGSSGFEGTFYISIVSPIYKENSLKGVIASDIEINSIKEELFTLLPTKDGFAFLMTRDGIIIAKPNQLGLDLEDSSIKNFLTKLTSTNVQNKTLTFTKNSFIFTYEPLGNSDWFFISILDENAVYSTLEDQLLISFIASFGLFGLGAGGFIFLSLTQRSLQEKHNLLGLFAKSPTWAVLLTDKKGAVLFVNKAFERVFSLKSKSIYGNHLDNVLPYLSINQANCNHISCFEAIKENSNQIVSYTFEKNDKDYRVQITPLLKYKKEFEGLIVTVNDITHEKSLEKKELEHEQILIQNSKMAALGEMVSAISHQWRQPLSTLLMLISNAEDVIKNNNKIKALNYLDRSRQTIELMNETIKAFRNFYKEDFGKATFDLVDVINEVILISTPQMKMNGIEFTFICKENNIYTCKGYPSYIKQVLINLIGNAKDELSLCLKDNPLHEAKVSLSLSKTSQGYHISVEDNGKGISEQNAKKIFEPFFTTKGEQGTGTGLHLCKLLTEGKMNGKLTLESSENPTKFLIYIGKDDV